jgi:hypothetical protein
MMSTSYSSGGYQCDARMARVHSIKKNRFSLKQDDGQPGTFRGCRLLKIPKSALPMLLGWICLAASSAVAQIGGKTANDGPFLLDGAEDLNLSAESVGRDWVSDFVYPAGDVLSVIALGGSGLTLGTGQSATGALRASLAASGAIFGGFEINGGFGVPVPAQVGASTLDEPGDITSFESLAFFAQYQSNTTGISFQVLLECYPQNGDSTFPTILWGFTPNQSTTFGNIVLDLRSPSGIVNNPSNLTVDQLLSQTRFLYFYHFKYPVQVNHQLTMHYDDIRLLGSGDPQNPMTAAKDWQVFE